ncbi:MAG TPA: hypothetical protein VF132_14540 [Rudaea sp.]
MQTVILTRTLRAVVLAAGLVLLAACGRDDLKRGTAEISQPAPPQYDLTLRADKDGQFDFDGATLTAEDLRGHIRYRNEPGHQPVKNILLKPGEKEKVKNTHVAGLAGICRDLHITGYVEDNDGRLKIIQITDDEKPAAK